MLEADRDQCGYMMAWLKQGASGLDPGETSLRQNVLLSIETLKYVFQAATASDYYEEL